MKRRAIASIALLLALPACTSTREEVRASAREQGTIHVDLPFATAYANFVRRAEECHHIDPNPNFFTAKSRVTFVEKVETSPGQSATVEVVEAVVFRHPAQVMTHNLLGLPDRRVLVSADLVAAGNGTDITYFVHPHVSIFVTFRPVMLEWANGTGTQCGGPFD